MHVPDIGYRATLPEALHRAARDFGDQEFLVTPTQRLTYAEAERVSRRVSKHLLAAGIGKGTHVGLIDTFGANWLIGLLSITRIGALAMPFASTYRPAELRRSLRHGDVHVLILPSTLLGRDMIEFVEEAIPELSSHASSTTLLLEELPFLRHVYVMNNAGRRWANELSFGFGPSADSDESAASDLLLQRAEQAVAPSDPMVVIFTSGATGEPKAVIHSHGGQVRHGWNLARNFGAGTSAKDRVYCALPFFWIGGLTYQLMGAMSVGSTVLCTDRFEPESALELMEKEGATRMVGWASQISAVRQHPTFTDHDLTSMPMFAPRTGREADPELRHTSLGMTETGGPHTACPPNEAGRVLPDEMRGSFGRSLPDVEHRIVDPETGEVLGDGEQGEICVRGYNLMLGIYKHERSEVFDEEGWFHTGDRGVFRNGYLFYFGRLGEMIKSAGANVSPREVEATLEGLPEVQVAIVVGLPDSARGEMVAAVVVPRPGATIDTNEIIAQVAKQLSSFKVPRRVEVFERDQVPWLATGKPDKRAIVDTLLSTRRS
jgi:acyl-CoA synthetase (AMP-forming)/AMP-acid ligase II